MIFQLPDELDFNLPSDISSRKLTVLQLDDEVLLYRQLICWCCIQRYWYYVLGITYTDDMTYDFIESYIKQMEREASYLENYYSPSRWVGADNPKYYPGFVRREFSITNSLK